MVPKAKCFLIASVNVVCNDIEHVILFLSDKFQYYIIVSQFGKSLDFNLHSSAHELDHILRKVTFRLQAKNNGANFFFGIKIF